MRISVRLYNRLQRLLPSEANGQTELDMPEGCKVEDVYGMLDIARSHPIAVNGVIERNLERALEEGDQVSLFSPISGG